MPPDAAECGCTVGGLHWATAVSRIGHEWRVKKLHFFDKLEDHLEEADALSEHS